MLYHLEKYCLTLLDFRDYPPDTCHTGSFAAALPVALLLYVPDTQVRNKMLLSGVVLVIM